MKDVKISLITVTFNAADTIEGCICSVIEQAYSNLEYIIIDGGSTDATLAIINKYKDHIHQIVSAPDGGIYDAMNKGIKLATGDIIGTLNADDRFAAGDILTSVAQGFASSGGDIIYGDINYVNREDKIIRKWKSGAYKHGCFNWGWMPPHPSFYAKRILFEQLGYYQIQYGSATDYELMLRFIHTNKAKVFYINKLMVNMLIGGVSNKSISNRIKAWRNDFKAMGNNGLIFPYFSIIWKPFRKIMQYIK
ncbi:MAG: glycosyltransferase family 2 protein [Bacteroidota bacterium]